MVANELFVNSVLFKALPVAAFGAHGVCRRCNCANATIGRHLTPANRAGYNAEITLRDTDRTGEFRAN
jgi:hypothetical protein